MNLGQMQTLIYRYGFDSSDPVTSVLNAAMHEIETEYDWPFLEFAQIFAQPAGFNTILVPSDFNKVIVLQDTDNLIKLTYMSYRKFVREIRDPTQVGTPQVYTIKSVGLSTVIQLWPVPQVTANYNLLYQASTVDMLSPGDVPTAGFNVWPSEMHMPIVFRAASVLLQMENEEDRAKTAQDQYMNALKGCMARFAERELDEPDSVQDTQGYGSSGLVSVGY